MYALPRTWLQVKLVLSVEVTQDNSRISGLNEIKELTLSVLDLPDRTAEYRINLDAEGRNVLLESHLAFKLAEGGFLVGADAVYKDKTGEVVKNLASIAVAVGKAGLFAIARESTAAKDVKLVDVTGVFYGDPADPGVFVARNGDLVWTVGLSEMLARMDAAQRPAIEVVLMGAARDQSRPSAAGSTAEDGLYCRFPRYYLGKISLRSGALQKEAAAPPVGIAQLGTLGRLPIVSKALSSRTTNAVFSATRGTLTSFEVKAGSSAEDASAALGQAATTLQNIRKESLDAEKSLLEKREALLKMQEALAQPGGR